MTPEQISLVQTSFARVAPAADAVAQAFYTRLFEIDPTLRRLFPADLAPQRAKLMQMLAAAVQGLDDLPRIVPVAAELGRRHAGYGVRAQHYATVGQALIDTLHTGLGDDFTPSLEAAWVTVYGALAGAMQSRAGASQSSALAA